VLTGGLALFLNIRLGYGVEKVGYVFMVSGFVGAALQGVLGRMVKRLGEPKLALIGFFTMAAGYPLLGLVFRWEVLVAIVCFASFGVTVVRPCVTTLITRSVSRREQGEALGTGQSLASISQMLGQPLAGLLIGHGLLWAYGVAAGTFALLGALLTLQPVPEADLPAAVPEEEKASV
jgi:MFS family permease